MCTGEIVRILNMNVFNHYITGINFMDEYDIACKSTYFVRYIGQFTCAWLTVTITAERCVTIALPLKVSFVSLTFALDMNSLIRIGFETNSSIRTELTGHMTSADN